MPLNLKLVNDEKIGNVLLSNFEAQFVECKKSTWASIKNIQNDFSRNFKDEIGQVQSEKISFNKFRIQVKDNTGKEIQLINLDTNQITSKINFKIRVNSLDLTKDETTHTKFVDVSLVADRVRQTSSDRFFEEVNWGSYRIQLSNK